MGFSDLSRLFDLPADLPGLRRAASAWARTDVLFYVLPLLMINLIAGTLAQRWLGLYAAQKIFFQGPVFWLLLGLITFSLLIKFLTASPWRWDKAGIILAHLGALILLLGGLMTALTAREHYMVIPQGQVSAYIYDYHQRMLFVFESNQLRTRLPFENLKEGKTLNDLPFAIQVQERCENCAIAKRENAAKDFQGMARFMALTPRAPEKEPEANISGITLRIEGKTYIAFEGMPKPIEITKKGKTYKLMFGKDQTALPFAVRLQKFTKENYPGTDMARAYQSDVIIEDGALHWPAHISMNAPLRYRGYTFYQSAFEERGSGPVTILSVVQNKGRLFPYIGTLVMAAGLLLHLALQNKTWGKAWGRS